MSKRSEWIILTRPLIVASAVAKEIGKGISADLKIGSYEEICSVSADC